MIRAGRIALPFVLLAIGAVAFYVSPWPAIGRLYLAGSHMRVAATWETVAPPLVTGLAWAGAIWLSLRVRRGQG